jgi:L,D-peptidoglycan transpeptidase YkuD (ErfK/YbiS/YcfS/YnhG family)
MLTLAIALLLHGCPQQVRVVAPSTASTVASLSLYECGKRVAGPWRARVGRRGLSAHHREGDGTTPLGIYAIGPTMYGLDADPGVTFRYHRLVCGDWWDEDPRSAAYNRFQHVACGATPPFGGGSEALWRATVAYRLFAVVQYNVSPTVPGRGSAIFLHVDTGRATNGCVSVAEPLLAGLLRRLRAGATISIHA